VVIGTALIASLIIMIMFMTNTRSKLVYYEVTNKSVSSKLVKTTRCIKKKCGPLSLKDSLNCQILCNQLDPEDINGCALPTCSCISTCSEYAMESAPIATYQLTEQDAKDPKKLTVTVQSKETYETPEEALLHTFPDLVGKKGYFYWTTNQVRKSFDKIDLEKDTPEKHNEYVKRNKKQKKNAAISSGVFAGLLLILGMVYWEACK
jgi:hypothetical protein